MVVRIGRSGDRPSEAASAWNPSAIWCPCLASPTWRQTSVTWCPNPTWSPGYPRNRWSPFPPLWHDQWTQRQIPLPTTQYPCGFPCPCPSQSPTPPWASVLPSVADHGPAAPSFGYAGSVDSADPSSSSRRSSSMRSSNSSRSHTATAGAAETVVRAAIADESVGC